MAKKNWLNFQTIKAAVGMEDILGHYGLLDKFNRKGEQLSGFCPLPCHTGGGKKSRSFSVNTAKNCWQCFSCNVGGNIFDFVRLMEKTDGIRPAAELISEWFNGVGAGEKPEQAPNTREPDAPDDTPAAQTKEEASEAECETTEPTEEQNSEVPAVEGNPPLTFTLKKLQTNHPYFKQRSLKQETIEHFELGLCSRGLLKGRVAIPIHNANGEIVAYVGRAVDEAGESEGKYKFPPNFHKALELFNLHRVADDSDHVILVEGFFDVFWLHQHGYQNAVALMGSSLSEEQERLLVDTLKPQGRVTLLFDGDEAGRRCTKEVLEHLSHHLFVQSVLLEPEQQPDSLDADALTALLG